MGTVIYDVRRRRISASSTRTPRITRPLPRNRLVRNTSLGPVTAREPTAGLGPVVVGATEWLCVGLGLGE